MKYCYKLETQQIEINMKIKILLSHLIKLALKIMKIKKRLARMRLNFKVKIMKIKNKIINMDKILI